MKYADRVKETTSTTGTGTLTLGGAVVGFRTFLSALTDNDLVPYVIEAANGTDWETGFGTYNAGTLARTVVSASSNAGSALNLAAGSHTVYLGIIAGTISVMREVLTAARTYYVATTGSDSNDGLTVGNPFLTVQKAVDTVASLDLSIYDVDINVADGEYNDAVVLKSYVGAGVSSIIGNITTPANVLFNVTSANAVDGVNCGRWEISGVKLQTTTSGSGLRSSGASKVSFSSLDFGQCYAAHLMAFNGGEISATGNYSISGGSNSSSHLYVYAGGRIGVNSRTVTISNTPAFSVAFAWSDRGMGYIDAFSMTFTGTGATGKRYSINMNSVCFVNGAASTYFPGSIAGTTGTGGQYA